MIINANFRQEIRKHSIESTQQGILLNFFNLIDSFTHIDTIFLNFQF